MTTTRAIAHRTTADLEAEAERLEDHDCNYEDDCSSCRRAYAIERELDARDMWDHEDARVCESVGNYR